MADAIPSGIRERKKLRTREALIEAAATLCLRKGFDNTTVEQIAAMADVSTRTFSRYFPTKAAVVAAIADEMDVLIAEELRTQPLDITEYEALLRAHLAVFGPELPYETPGFRRMAALIQIVNGSESAKSAAFVHQQGVTENAALRVVAERMGVAPDDPVIRLISDTFTVLFSSSFAGLGMPGNDPIDARVVCDRLAAQFEIFRRTWAPWNTSGAEGQPHASAPGA